MSLTSCYGYVVELSESTLTELLRSVIAQGETSGLPTTFTDSQTFGGFNVEITASLVDTDARPSQFELTAADLEATLHLHMDISIELVDMAGVDPLTLQVTFRLPGVIAKNSEPDPDVLEMTFDGLSSSDLDVQLSGDGLVFNASLFEQPIHEMFLEHALYNTIEESWYLTDTGVDILGAIYFVKVWFYDDDPASATSRGSIWVDLVDADTITVNIPSRLHALDVTSSVVYDISFVLEIDVDIRENALPSGGREIEALLDEVEESDIRVVDVVFNMGLNIPGAELILQGIMAERVVEELTGPSASTNPSKEVPTEDDIVEAIETGLLEFADGLEFPLLPLAESGSGSVLDLSTSVPTTVDGEVLALQIEPLDDGTPCDGVDKFLGTSRFAVAVSEPRVRALLDDVEAALDGSSQEFGGYDVTMHRPNTSLHDAGDHGVAVGHIWVTGSATVHVGGCVGDVEATYQGSLTLTPINNPDGSLGFDVVPGEFSGDTDAKDKKDDFDTNGIRDLIGGMEFPFPDIPRAFEGVGTIEIEYTTAVISSEGIVIGGGVTIQTLNAQMISGVFAATRFWAMDSARER